MLLETIRLHLGLARLSIRIVPPERNVDLLKGYLAEAGNRQYSIRVIPEVAHDFMHATTGGRLDYLHRSGFGGQYLTTIIEWVRARTEQR